MKRKLLAISVLAWAALGISAAYSSISSRGGGTCHLIICDFGGGPSYVCGGDCGTGHPCERKVIANLVFCYCFGVGTPANDVCSGTFDQGTGTLNCYDLPTCNFQYPDCKPNPAAPPGGGCIDACTCQ